MFERVTLIGYVGGDPESRFTPNGTQVTNFSVATRRTVGKDRSPSCPQGWKESQNGRSWELTTWWRISAWGRLAEVTQEFLQKGALVMVEGEVSGNALNGSQNPRVWVDRDGQARASYELTARAVKFLSRNNGGGGGTSQEMTESEEEFEF